MVNVRYMGIALSYRMKDRCVSFGWHWVNKCWSGIFLLSFANSILSIGDNTDEEEVWWLVMDLDVDQFLYF
jgi:hypothetical protein